VVARTVRVEAAGVGVVRALAAVAAHQVDGWVVTPRANFTSSSADSRLLRLALIWGCWSTALCTASVMDIA
jgi:hypothetical protein